MVNTSKLQILEEIPKEVLEQLPLELRVKLFCPKCGELPTFWFPITVRKKTREGTKEYKYIMLGHYSIKDKSVHRWCFAPLTEENLKTIKALKIYSWAKWIVFDGNDLEELKKLFNLFDTEAVPIPEKMRELAKALKGARKILVRVYY